MSFVWELIHDSNKNKKMITTVVFEQGLGSGPGFVAIRLTVKELTILSRGKN